MEKTHILSALVDNNSGVLLRISGLFSRRGYNIESLSAARTESPDLSRMTIVVRGDNDTLEQIEKQLMKLVDVKQVKVLDQDTAVCREHILIKVENSEKTRSCVLNISNLYGASIIDTSGDSIMLELTGDHRKLMSFIDILEPYKITQLVKTGISALERG